MARIIRYWRMCLTFITGLLLAIAAHGHGPVEANEPIYVLVAGPPRMGTTWLYNAVRLLVRYHDPNVISGFATSFKDRDLCYWKSRNVSMVVKTHALYMGYMLGSNCKNGDSTSFVTGFDKAVTSFRDPFESGCSLVKKDGRVQKDMCEKVMCEQHAFYHPPQMTVHGQPVHIPEVAYEMDFRDLRSGLVIEILKELAKALGIQTALSLPSSDSTVAANSLSEDVTLQVIARELSMLRPLGDPIHSLRSAQHPVTLMHSNHVGIADESACETDPGLQFMKANPVCHELAEQHGRQSDALWDQYKENWQGHCVRLRRVPEPAGEDQTKEL